MSLKKIWVNFFFPFTPQNNLYNRLANRKTNKEKKLSNVVLTYS
jgi:hypothetical protein